MFIISIISIFGLLITLLTTDGVVNRQASSIWSRLTKKGYVLVLLITFSAFFTIFDKCQSENQETQKEASISILKNKSDSLKLSLNDLNERNDFEKQIARIRFDSVQNSMSNFQKLAEKESYISGLDRRLRILENRNLKQKIDSLKGDLKEANQTNSLNLKSNAPKLECCDYLQWSAYGKDSLYKLGVNICNVGKRSALNMEVQFCIFFLDKESTEIIEHACLPENRGFISLPPYSETNKMSYYVLRIDKLSEIYTLKPMMIKLQLTCKDELTGDKISTVKYYTWESISRSIFKFDFCSELGVIEIERYMRVHTIALKN